MSSCVRSEVDAYDAVTFRQLRGDAVAPKSSTSRYAPGPGPSRTFCLKRRDDESGLDMAATFRRPEAADISAAVAARERAAIAARQGQLQRLLDAMRDAEAKEAAASAARLAKVDKLVAKKNDLVDKTRREILAVLTPEQTNELPGKTTPRLNDPSARGGNAAQGISGRGANRFLKQPPKILPSSASEGSNESQNSRPKRIDRLGNQGDGSAKGSRRGGASED